LCKEFDYENGVAVGNDNVTIVLFKGEPSPETIDHMSFQPAEHGDIAEGARAFEER